MSQLAMELSHINKVRKALEVDFKNDKIKQIEYYDLDLKYLSESSKRLNGMIGLIVSAAKHGPKVSNMALKQNLIGHNEAISTGNVELEMIKCPDKDDMLITREACLSYSGDEKNFDKCKSCENFSINRRLLCPAN